MLKRHDRILAPASTNGYGGFSLKHLTWLFANSPGVMLQCGLEDDRLREKPI